MMQYKVKTLTIEKKVKTNLPCHLVHPKLLEEPFCGCSNKQNPKLNSAKGEKKIYLFNLLGNGWAYLTTYQRCSSVCQSQRASCRHPCTRRTIDRVSRHTPRVCRRRRRRRCYRCRGRGEHRNRSNGGTGRWVLLGSLF